MRQLVIHSRNAAPDGGMGSLGTRRAIVERLAGLNTAPETPGGDVLYGPGILIELPIDDDDDRAPITQMMLTIVEEEIAWLVIMKLARELDWKLLDPMSGRELSAT